MYLGPGGWGYIETLLNALDPKDPRNREMFDFIPEAIINHRQPMNEDYYTLYIP